MSVQAIHRSGYEDAARALGTPRSIEYKVFSQTTGRLKRNGCSDSDFNGLADALHDNLRLWSAIAADVAEPENGLPAQLRAQLFYLYEFTATETRKILRRETDAAALIEINTTVMRGLRGQLPASED